MKETIILKVSRESDPNKVAGAIVAFLNEDKIVELHAIGAGALNQAIKSAIVARSFVAPQGVNLTCIPAFISVDVAGEDKTGIKIILREEI